MLKYGWKAKLLLLFACNVFYHLVSAQSLQITTASGTTCGYSNGVIFGEVTGGKEPFTFTLTPGTTQPSGLFTGLAAGSYTLTVVDANGASATQTTTLTNTYPKPSIAIVSTTTPTSCTSNNGSVEVVGSNGVPPFSFSKGDGAFVASPVFNGLSPGTYTFLVRDANNCLASIRYTFPLTCPVSVTTSGPVCGAKGTATVTPGTGYTYTLNALPPTTNPVFINLNPGFYRLSAKNNATGDVYQTTFSIGQSCTIPVTTTTTQARCSDKDGTITITAGSGNPPLFYAVVGRDFQSSNVITGLGPGYYTVDVKDANGNIGEQTAVRVPGFCPVLQLSSSDAGCTVNNGTITVTNHNGVEPVLFSKDGVLFVPDLTFTNLAPGNYTITSKDANDVVTTSDIGVGTTPSPVLSLTSAESGCAQDDGSIVATFTGGTGQFTYQLNGNAAQPGGNFQNLASGNYTIKVSDENGCSDQQDIVVEQATGPVITGTVLPSGCSTTNGSVTIATQGGTAPFKFRIGNNPDRNDGNFTGLSAGAYVVTVTDAKGCSTQESFTVTTTTGPALNYQSDSASCKGNDGTISATGVGAAAPFVYNIDNGAFQASGDFNGLSNGSHSVSVKDANGCTISQNIVVGVTNDLQVDAGGNTSVCAGASVTLRGQSSVPALWSPAASLADPNMLSTTASPKQTTRYYLTATSGVCVRVDSVTVTVNDLPIADAGKDISICYDANTTLNGSGGIAFSWSPSLYLDNDHSKTPAITGAKQTVIYELVVSDANGCKSLPDAVTVTVTPPPRVFAGNDTSVIIGQPAVLHATDLNGTGFTSYAWTPPFGLDNPSLASPTLTPSVTQTFTVTAATPEGCSATDDITVKVFKEPDIFVPNAFTPNGDGKNDVLRAIPIGIKTFNYFAVYNRSGQQVFMTKDPGNGWDGSIGSLSQNTAGFVWMAQGVDLNGQMIQRKGVVIVIR